MMANVTASIWDDTALRPYFWEVKRRHGVVDLLALPNMRDLPPVRIESLFVQPVLSERPVSPTSNPQIWPEGKSLLANLEESNCIILLGDPGSGKTTLANWLAWRLSAGSTSPLPKILENRIPVPCILRELNPSAFAPEVGISQLSMFVAKALLGDTANDATINAVSNRVNGGDYVLILDGVDEIPVERRYKISQWIEEARFKGAVAVATSRIVGYEDFPIDSPRLSGTFNAIRNFLITDPKTGRMVTSIPSGTELKIEEAQSTHLSSRPYVVNKSGARRRTQRLAAVRYLMPFDQKRITAFVNNWYLQRTASEKEAKEKAADLLNALDQSHITSELARTPNLLSLIAIVHRERANLPDGKALLYKEIANAYINTIDQYRKIGVDDAISSFNWETRENWLAFVGFQMQLLRSDRAGEDQSGVLVEEKKIIEWLETAIRQSGAMDAELLAIEFLRWVARRSGLLLPRGEGRYAFVHLSFQEYFCARYLSSKIVSPTFARKQMSVDKSVSASMLQEWADTSAWREIFVYLFELISGERDEEWLEILYQTIFDDTENLISNKAELATRLMLDSHIHITGIAKRSLLECCANYAIELLTSEKNSKTSHPLVKLLEHDELYISKNNSIGDKRNHEGGDELIAHLNSEVLALELEKYQIKNPRIISRLKRLRYLRLSNCSFSNTDFLEALENLCILDISNSTISEISHLTKGNKLEHLDVSGTQIHDISFLEKVPNLMRLVLSHSKVHNLYHLKHCNNLISLELDGLHNISINDLGEKHALHSLTLINSIIDNPNGIENFKNLMLLNLRGTNIHTLPDLKSLNKLVMLDITKSGISEIGKIDKLQGLLILLMRGTNVSDLSPLSKLEKLIHLDISMTKVRDLTPLTNCQNLATLRILGMEGLDLTPLNDIPTLRSLAVSKHSNADFLSDRVKITHI